MSEVRADKLQGVWANTAETTIPGSPTTGTAYRNTAYDVTGGFEFNTKSPSEAINQWLYTASKIIADLELKGTLGWNSTTAYLIGAIAMGSDAAIYQCIQNATGKDPTTETSYWTKLDVLNRAMTSLSNITTVAMAADNAVKTAPDVVTSYWVATDGLSYYRKWKSGFIEQGGSYPNEVIHNTGRGVINFQVAFTTKVITIQATAFVNESGSVNGSASVIPTLTDKTKATIGAASDTIPGFYWYACGF